MPQRKDNSLYLWNLDKPEAPAYTFAGHSDTPTEFVWRVKSQDQSKASITDFAQEYQLVTWSKDMHLRLWPISRDIAAYVGHYQGQSSPVIVPESKNTIHRPRRTYSDTHLHGTSSGSDTPESSYSSLSPSSSTTKRRDFGLSEEELLENNSLDIEAELSRVQDLFPTISIDKTNLVSRKVIIKLERLDPSSTAKSTKPVLFLLGITFPRGYPAEPAFCDIQRNWSISMMNRTFLSRKLALIAGNYSKKRLRVVEMIVKYLMGSNYQPISTSEDSMYKHNQSPTSMPISSSRSNPSVGMVSSEKDADSDSSDSVSQSPEDIFLPKAFNAERGGTVAPAEESDSFSDDSSIGEGIGVMAIGRKFGESMSNFDKSGNNVPFPRLCGASFSPTGIEIYMNHLICFL